MARMARRATGLRQRQPTTRPRTSGDRAFPGKVEPGFPSGNATKQRVRALSRLEETRKRSRGQTQGASTLLRMTISQPTSIARTTASRQAAGP
ncbi:hypothetical protein AGR7A_Cc210235 [Agrobacterium deltaense NCPPB 1641]|uniref:Uncharacterized protein n=1 Tax=Agrobacterium deltaense NCPPB 1641 TaxID=1183425 RepID=A0A1S7TM47_9HYPH|nr:hypothetical protein AGR7A_Cc210235 [Agrobacterium deltaense NCPPB 1641]